MTLKKYSLALLLTWLIGWLGAEPTRADGLKQEFSKKINREFGISSTGTTAIYNKYGNVKVNTWANRSVKMEITIVVNAADQRAADRVFERIQVNFLHTADYVRAETVIEPERSYSSGVGGFKAFDFKIHYDVWLPADNQLDLKNRYGDALVSNLKGKLMAEIRYGNLRGENLSGDADLSISYGKASFNQVRSLTGYINYSDLLAERANDVNLDTRYSDVRITQASQVRLTSKYDKLNFGEVEALRLQTRYTDLRGRQIGSLFLTAQYTDSRIERLTETLDADLNYGELDIRALGRQFSEARVQGKYTDVKIAVEPGASFRLDAEGRQTDVQVPHLSRSMYRETIGGQVRVSGFAGDANAPRVITARLQYGDFILK
ncbi:MAG: DUF4097 family beta strand repeat-containing protein [Saprospiraceae bacterium]|nr:DUF4097 family beta strand repeat-containing protein [Saprospiraceae bacterium]MDW8229121.1 DUF4097 family beta strand repeat-containing protein [Saprospiraceae bacterium]